MPNSIHLTVATVVERDSTFLMVRETIDGEQVINQPAGHVEPGEDVMAAALRETIDDKRLDAPNYRRYHNSHSSSLPLLSCFPQVSSQASLPDNVVRSARRDGGQQCRGFGTRQDMRGG